MCIRDSLYTEYSPAVRAFVFNEGVNFSSVFSIAILVRPFAELLEPDVYKRQGTYSADYNTAKTSVADLNGYTLIMTGYKNCFSVTRYKTAVIYALSLIHI